MQKLIGLSFYLMFDINEQKEKAYIFSLDVHVMFIVAGVAKTIYYYFTAKKAFSFFIRLQF